jgi:putative transposase
MIPPIVRDLGGHVLNITVQPDHVHLFVEVPPTLAPRQVMHRVKGVTSHQLRQEFPHLRSRLPSLWTRRYMVKTVGRFHASEIDDFVAAQGRS